MTTQGGAPKLVVKATGVEVEVGQSVMLDGELFLVHYFKPPHKPSSQGKITIKPKDGSTIHCQEFYVSVLGMGWINRTDQPTVIEVAEVKELEDRQIRIQNQVMNGHLDITAPEWVEVRYDQMTNVIWVNINGICALRACRIKNFISDLPEGRWENPS